MHKNDDLTFPLSTYSKSKYMADMALTSFKDVLSFRIRMPISHKKSPRNLLDKLAKYSQLIDVPNSVSFLSDIVDGVEFGIKNNLSGIYHLTSDEPLSAAQIMLEYQKYNSSYKFDVIDVDELGKIVSAPRSNCILNNDKLKSKGFVFRNSHEALKDCLERYFKENNYGNK